MTNAPEREAGLTLKLYHAEPVANSLKTLIALKEKALAFESIYIDLHKFEQHAPWFVALNPEGQVPVLDHGGAIITHTTVINEYLEDAFPEAPALRPADPRGKARMRHWNKFVDEQVMNHVSLHGWSRMVAVIARSLESDAFEQMVARAPLKEQRDKWRNARAGFSEEQLAAATLKIEAAVDRVEGQLAHAPWLAGDMFTLADVNFFAHCGHALARMFPEIGTPERCPRLLDWADRVRARPGVQAALAMPDHTHPALRTLTGAR